MLSTTRTRLWQLRRRGLSAVHRRMSQWTRPVTPGLATGLLADLARSRRELIRENARLRQHLLVLHRTAKRPALTAADRGLLVLLASRLRSWASTRVIVRPATVLRWHRQGFRLLWRRTSAPRPATPRILIKTVAPSKPLAAENRLWGAERSRGELLKLHSRVSQRTIQRDLRHARPPGFGGQRRATCLRNQAQAIWACAFLQVTDLFFRPRFACFIVERASRRVLHVGVMRSPTDAWVTQRLREATPYGALPRYLIRDRASTYGPQFARLAATSGITVLQTPVQAPRANAVCARFFGSVRRAGLDHLLTLTEAHLRQVLRQYVTYFNGARPHQGLGQRVPDPSASLVPRAATGGKIRAVPVLGGLHHAYQWAG